MKSWNFGSVVRGEAQLVEALQEDVRVEDAEHRLLAEGGRHRANAQLDLPAALLALDPPVLRPALLGDVAAGEQLDAGDDRLVDDLRDDVDVVQDPVDPQPHQGEVAAWARSGCRMPAARTRRSRMWSSALTTGAAAGSRSVDAFDRNSWLPRSTVESRLSVSCFSGVLEAGLEVVEALVDRLDVGSRGDDAVHVEAGHALDVLERERRERVVDGDRDPVLGLRDRHHSVPPREWPGDRLRHDVEVEVERVDLHVGQAGLRRQRLCDLDLVDEAELQHRLLGSQAVQLLGAAHPVDLLGSDRPRGDEDRDDVGRRRHGRCVLAVRGQRGHGSLARIIRAGTGRFNGRGRARAARAPRASVRGRSPARDVLSSLLGKKIL